MAYSRFLLLLIGVISSHLPGVQSRPVDFWCNRDARKNLVKTIEELKKDMADCVGSHILPSPLQLPPVWVQPAEWANKTFQQKRAEVLGALRVLQDGVQRATSQTTLQCQASLLERLGHHVTNYVGLVSSLQIQADRETSSHPEVPNSPPQTSLTKVLERYRNLLKGKLERLAVDLKDSLCHAEHRTDDS
ncbi:thrombopoietin-like isoform X2 [Labrus bergylta]|uniref:Thrombopoietin n=1 Tax=Labrus bergylta TaxID=56723 RepID=A0A3Q3MNY3_9LABR